MDIAFSIISGLFLRAVVNSVQAEPLSKVATALVGIWEGVVVHQMSSRSTSEVDHYLAYGLRVLIDTVISKDQFKAVMILVWTALGAFASESVTPRSTLQAPAPKRERRTRASRTRSSNLRTYQQRHSAPNPAIASTSLAPRLPLLPPALQTPQFPVTKPPSPPSFFLGAGSDFSPIPAPVHPLDLSPTRPPTGLASHLEKGEESDSPAPKRPHLPTPPQSTPSDGLEVGNSRPTASPNRLSTIQEISSAAERTPHQETTRAVEKDAQIPSTNPSGHSSPLPIPNLTMQGFSISNAFNDNDQDTDDSNDHEIKHSTPFTAAISAHAPVPVPNMSTSGWQPHVVDPLGVNNPLDSPPWDNEDALDELRTPPSHRGGGADLGHVEMDDPLRTPITMNAHMLSPLLLDEEDLGSGVPLVSVITGPMPSISQIQALVEPTPPAPVRAKTNKRNNAQAGPSSTQLHAPGTLLSADVPSRPSSPKAAAAANDPPSDPETHSDNASVFSTQEPTDLTRKAEKLRQEARDAEKEWQELKAKHQAAVNQGKTAEAFILKRKMYDAEERANESHKKAAKRYFASLNEFNPKKKEDTIDVHGLRPTEALDRAERALSRAMDSGLSTLRVIVGKGLHSVNGQPVLKQVINQAMLRQKIACKVDPQNAGVLILSVPTQ